MTSCSALPTPMEMGEMVFVRTLGVDAVGEGVSLTASTGLRGRGLNQDSEPTLTLTGTGDSISGAIHQVGEGCDRQPFYGYLDQLLLGEEFCQGDILPVLEYFARDVELGLGTEVWAVEGTATDAISSGGEEGVTESLSTLQQEQLQGKSGLTRTVGQLLTDLLEEGSTYVPLLIPTEEGLVTGGYTIIIRDTACGRLTGDGARGLELLEGEPSGEVFRGTSNLVAEVSGVNCSFAPVVAGGVLVGAEVSCRMTANLTEYDQPPTQQELKQLSAELAEQEKGRISLALTELQEMGGDPIGLGRKLGMASPWLWEEMQENWTTQFLGLPIWMDVQVNIGRE